MEYSLIVISHPENRRNLYEVSHPCFTMHNENRFAVISSIFHTGISNRTCSHVITFAVVLFYKWLTTRRYVVAAIVYLYSDVTIQTHSQSAALDLPLSTATLPLFKILRLGYLSQC